VVEPEALCWCEDEAAVNGTGEGTRMSKDNAGNVSLKLLVIKTARMDPLRAFYECLGIPLADERHGTGPTHFAANVGETVFEVYPLTGGATVADSTTRLGFAVADLDRVLAALHSLGTSLLDPPRDTPWGRRAVVRDPDGRAVELSPKS
jgi:predicted enzyme related to lactoylglutathione lyase